MSFPASNILAAAVALVAVLALVILSGRAARLTGFARNTTGRRLAVQETLALDRGRRMHVVRCDGREVLLLTGGAGDVVVGWLPEQPGA